MFTFSKACNFFCSLGTNFLSWGGRVKKDSNWKIHDKKKQIKSRSPNIWSGDISNQGRLLCYSYWVLTQADNTREGQQYTRYVGMYIKILTHCAYLIIAHIISSQFYIIVIKLCKVCNYIHVNMYMQVCNILQFIITMVLIQLC